MNSSTIKIVGIFGLRDAIEDVQPHLVISITDPCSDTAMQADRILDEAGTPSVRLRFHDSHYGQASPVLAQFSMLEDVAEAIDAHVPNESARIVVHCHAGQQRSPAMAIFALGHLQNRTAELNEDSAAEVVETVFAAAPDATPNNRVLDMASDLLDVPGWFHGAISERKKRLEVKRPVKGARFAKKRKRAFRV